MTRPIRVPAAMSSVELVASVSVLLAPAVACRFADSEAVHVRLSELAPTFENPIKGPRVAIVKVTRLLVACGLAESGSDASRKIKANAVQIDGHNRGVTEVVFEFQKFGLRHPFQLGVFDQGIRMGKRSKIVILEWDLP